MITIGNDFKGGLIVYVYERHILGIVGNQTYAKNSPKHICFTVYVINYSVLLCENQHFAIAFKCFICLSTAIQVAMKRPDVYLVGLPANHSVSVFKKVTY